MAGDEFDCDVLIVGAGPTGTTLAIDLARRGLSTRLVERRQTSFEGSRAKGVQPRTQEVLEDVGALAALREAGSPYPLLGVHIGPFTLPWRMMSATRPTAAVPHPNMILVPQYVTDSVLHARLRELNGSVVFQTELTALSQDERGVTATLAHHGAEHTVRARYLVGADGGGSLVRQALGIEFPGETHDDDRMIIADAVTTGLRDDRWHIWPGRSGRFVAACPLPGSEPVFQWMIRLATDDEPGVTREAIEERIQARTRNSRVQLRDVRWTSVFRPNIRLADRYRVGRVFLAGDAAHVHPPAGAQGLNTGIQDAYNLGWKLGQVLAGAPDTLLDSYEAERRPVAAAVLSLSSKKYDGLTKPDRATLKRGKDESQLTVTYRNGAASTNAGDRTATLHAGDRAPDAMLSREGGASVRLFDLMRGPHFTALAYGTAAAAELAALAWPDRGVGLRRVAVDAKSDTLVHNYRDVSGGFRRDYGLSGDTLLLLRPDGHIAAVATHDRPDRLAAVVDAMAPPVR